MTFEQEIAAIDNLARSCRDRAQANDLLEQEVSLLKQDNASLTATLESLTAVSKRDEAELCRVRDALTVEVRSNGELEATLKQLLAEQMALASRAAEMLRSLEKKPEPVLVPRKPEVQIIINEEKEEKEKKVLLDKFIAKDNEDLRDWPVGEKFVLDPPTTDVIGLRGLKHWYRAHGRVPGNWRERPSIEFMREPDGKRFLGFILQKQEDREPLPFRTEEASITGNGKTPDPFADNGEDIPGFLRGPRHDDDQGRKASDL